MKRKDLEFSKKYDAEHAKAYFEKHQSGLWRKISNWRDQQICRQALKIAGNPNSILDMPCGTGRFWPLLAEKKNRAIIAADYSQEMIDIGMAYRSYEITQKIQTLQTSAFDLTMNDNSVDCVFCIRLLHHIGTSEDRMKILDELHRVTRQSVIISLWVDGNYKAWRRKKLERKRTNQSYQNRFVLPVEMVEKEFENSGFIIKKHIDFIPKYAMWRTYVLSKDHAFISKSS